MKNILVFFGGVSQEHGVSVITGVLTVNSIDKTKFNPLPIYIDDKGEWWSGDDLKNIGFYKNFTVKRLEKVCLMPGDNQLYKIKKNKLKPMLTVACAINAIHGKNGEDGTLCGVLQMSNIPLASPNMFCSSLSMDKNLTKLVVGALGIETVKSQVVSQREFCANREEVLLTAVNGLNFPLIVKPLSSGSSIGIAVAEDITKLEKAVEDAFKYDDEVVIESYLKGACDINCAVYSVGEKYVVSPCEKPVTANEILTFADKYNGSKSSLKKEFPANIPDDVKEQIQANALTVYKTLGFCSIVRMDFLLSGEKVYLNEINAVPGSLAYYLFCNKISEFSDLLTDILNEAMKKSQGKKQYFNAFNSKFLLEKIKGSKL